MKIYLAPMEGVTGNTYRRIYGRHFENADRYFTPFISAHEKRLGKKAINELLPENNPDQNLIPQIMVGTLKEYMELERLIGCYGYNELNINAGCPSGTVVSKNRGSGLLKEWDKLDDLLEQIFDYTSQRVSIKTRLGWSDVAEWEQLAKVYGRYPLTEVIIHARVKEEYYKGSPHWECLDIAHEYIKAPIIYNGDIYTVQEAEDLIRKYPWIDGIMVGRGVLRNPLLIQELEAFVGNNKEKNNEETNNNQLIFDFMSDLFNEYMSIFNSEINTLFHMKELWSHLGASYPDNSKDLKIIYKTKSVSEYKLAVKRILG